MSGRRWKIIVGDESSRGKLSAGLGARGLENDMWECYTVKKMLAKSLLRDASTAWRLGESWTELSAVSEELLCFAKEAVCI